MAVAMAPRSRAASLCGSPTRRVTRALSTSGTTKSRLRARPGDAGLPVRRSSPTFVAFIEVAAHELDQSRHRLGRVVAMGAEVQRRTLGRLECHHLHDALGIDPRSILGQAQLDPAGESLGELRQLDGRTRMQADLMLNDARARDCAFRDGPVVHRAEYSSAVCRTVSTLDPPAASVAATTAPTTRGALQFSTRLRFSSGSISIAISLLVCARPRSSSTTTPLSDQARSMAAMIWPTSVP